jgi:peptidoglycan/xylan/chitin deacetylase (PgdA/CDA1 family)
MEVTVEMFEAHLVWLAQNATVVDLDTALEHRSEAAKERLVVLTFDDGYEDLFRLGYPRLRAHGFPFLVYLTTEPVETGRPLSPPSARPLTWDQVRVMAEEGGMTVGAHTHRHPNLRFLGAAEIAEELDTSNALIKSRIGQPPRHFAYPYGHWSPEADKEVRARYSTAALGGGRPNSRSIDLHLLHRVPIQLSDGVFFFRRKLRSGLRWEEPVRRLIQGYRGP